MSLVSICSTVFNPAGALIFDASKDSSFGAMTKRVTRTKTLDGGATIEDLGFSWGDNEWSIVKENYTEAEITSLRSMLENETAVTLACYLGVFSASLGQLNESDGKLTLNILIDEKVNS